MSDMFFYQERGKTVGPFSAEDIKGRIKDGSIRVFDLLYKDGEPSWRMALEHSTLRSEFKSSTLASLKERPWVCLQKKSPKSTEFVTTGPFTQDEIREALQAGKISYSDYAWKDSLAEWKRIGSLEEFNPRARNAILPAVPAVPQETSTDLLKNVVEFQRPLPVKPVFDDIPPEAESDYSPPPVPVNPPPAKKSDKSIKAPPAVSPDSITRSMTLPPPAPAAALSPVEKRAANTSSIRIHSESKVLEDDLDDDEKPQPWFDWGLVGVLALVLVAVVLIVSRFILPRAPVTIPEQNVTQDLPAPVIAPPAPPPVKAETVPPVSAPAPAPKAEAPPPPHAPGELVLAVHASPNGGQPQIELRTDGTAEYPIHLQIVGLPGQVSDGGSYYRFIRIIPKGKLKENLEIPGVKLPQGKFIVRAEAGELKKESKFTWGINEAQYKSTIARQRKSWSSALWKERLNLFILSDALEKQVSQAMVPTKKFPAKKWESLIALKRGEGGRYLMFEDWWELHNIAKEAKAGVSGPLAARAQKERERISSFSVWK